MVLAVSVLIVGAPLVVVRTIFRDLGPEDFYPPAPPMPTVVPETDEALLARYERILRDRAPDLFASLQPGLKDGQIDALENKYHFRLSHDLRTLYRWRNGTRPWNTIYSIYVFADYGFVPLEEASAARAHRGDMFTRDGFLARQFRRRFEAHDAWLAVFESPMGDGYFFDPDRSESEGSFFFSFLKNNGDYLEYSEYVFFPSLRNFLAWQIEGQKSGALGFGPNGACTVDPARARDLLQRYGVSPCDKGVAPDLEQASSYRWVPHD